MVRIEGDKSLLTVEASIRRGRAVSFAMAHDDGLAIDGYQNADVILVGLPRTGKTLVSLQLALSYGIFSANYPLTIEDLKASRFPRIPHCLKEKFFGITIQPNYWYSILIQSGRENQDMFSIQDSINQVRAANNMLRANVRNLLDVTGMPVEKVATEVLKITGLEKRFVYSENS